MVWHKCLASWNVGLHLWSLRSPSVDVPLQKGELSVHHLPYSYLLILFLIIFNFFIINQIAPLNMLLTIWQIRTVEEFLWWKSNFCILLFVCLCIDFVAFREQERWENKTFKLIIYWMSQKKKYGVANWQYFMNDVIYRCNILWHGKYNCHLGVCTVSIQYSKGN